MHVQGRVEERLGRFGVEVADQLRRALEVGKQHGDLLALAFQGAFGGEDLLRQIGWGVREWCGSGDSMGAEGDEEAVPVSPVQTKPRPSSSMTSGWAKRMASLRSSR